MAETFLVALDFVAYLSLTLAYLVFAYYHLAPKYGPRNMLVYISMCSLGGSVLVIACKAYAPHWRPLARSTVPGRVDALEMPGCPRSESVTAASASHCA